MRKIVYFLVLGILFPFFVSHVHAQANSMRLTLSPVFINLTTDPGASSSAKIRISNDGIEKEQLVVGVKKFTAGEGGESPLIIEPKKDDEFISWISFDKSKLSIEPGETETLTATITTPKTASLGYYYLITFSRSEPKKEKGNTIAFSGVPAIPVLLEVRSPNAERTLQITDFTTDQFIYEYLPSTLNVKLTNKGNVHVVPVGDIFIDQGKKENIAVLPVNAERGNVLPQTSRVFSVIWDDGFGVKQNKTVNGEIERDSSGKPKTKTVWDLSKADKLRFGKYNAHVIVVYDNGERDVPLEAVTSFWIIPWKILLLALGIGIVLFFGLRSILLGIYRKVWRR